MGEPKRGGVVISAKLVLENGKSIPVKIRRRHLRKIGELPRRSLWDRVKRFLGIGAN